MKDILSKKNKLMWVNAKKNISNGNMLISKNPEMLLPDLWPTYFSKTKGNKVWDLDNNKYTDMFFGVGTNIIGYNNKEVDNFVIKNLKKGNMSSLNCSEEVILSNNLLKMHPWAGMVKFARSGGEANAIAIRIARAYSNKEKIAICGYHGWHDWYISANINKYNNLNNHLLSGIGTAGVPKKLKNTVFPFRYNNFEELYKIVENNDLAAIKMEVSRNEGPTNNFLKKVRDLATKKGILLIFDECTSGFRETFGGLHLKYKINPDMAMFGKALGNGYAITSVIGKKEIMAYADNTFISSTFWTERIGPTAAIKTLEIMKETKSWKKITRTGKIIKQNWKDIASQFDLDLKISGIDALCSFTFNHVNNNFLRTFFIQEMLKEKILASNVVFVSLAHDEKTLENYFNKVKKTFEKITKIIDKDPKEYLKSRVAKSSFGRLN